MPRLLLLLAALLPLAAAGQGVADKPAEKKDPAGAPLPEEVQAAIKKEVEKAKADLRDEVRAELQGQQSAKEFLDAGRASDRPKLDLFQIEGYLRVRGDLLDGLTLHRAADPGGFTLFPPPISNPDNGTQTSANMRLRLEPVLNVSEQVRVLAQLDLLDGIVLGSTSSGAAASEAGGQGVPEVGRNGIDRSSIRVKRAWGEVQTPVGLLSFGRMPDPWGLGISYNAGAGVDDDLGDSVDRLQMAIAVRQTFLGPWVDVVVPYYDINSSGLVSRNLGGLGQPFSLDKADERWTLGLKLAKIDTDDELRRKNAAGKASWNYGLRYGYHQQNFRLEPATGTPGDLGPAAPTVNEARIGLSYHSFDLWGRYRTARLRVEAEAALRFGGMDDGRLAITDPSLGPIQILEFGGVVQSDLRFDKLLVGLEWGYASGDASPGIGLRPGRGPAQRGWIDGAQYAVGDARLSITNLAFNPAYRVDLILWRELYGAVSDAWYLKPSVRYDVLDGLSLRAALVYSQAIYASSTPSATHKPLGLELDTGIHYASDDGFLAWVQWGVLQPLDGLGYGAFRDSLAFPVQTDLKRAHAVRAGLGIKF
jgi:uncharacterized protein (TIGR04551 family)